MRTCPNGHIVPAGDMFCGKCGQPVGSVPRKPRSAPARPYPVTETCPVCGLPFARWARARSPHATARAATQADTAQEGSELGAHRHRGPPGRLDHQCPDQSGHRAGWLEQLQRSGQRRERWRFVRWLPQGHVQGGLNREHSGGHDLLLRGRRHRTAGRRVPPLETHARCRGGDDGAYISISAQQDGAGTVTCEVWVDGRPVNSSESSGETDLRSQHYPREGATRIDSSAGRLRPPLTGEEGEAPGGRWWSLNSTSMMPEVVKFCAEM